MQKELKMIDNLINVGYGIVVLGILIGVGSVVLFEFGDAVGGKANTNTDYVLTQIGSTGLAGWVPAIIAISIGLVFLGAFMIKGTKGRY